MHFRILFGFVVALAIVPSASAQPATTRTTGASTYDRARDVIYGRSSGTSLTMDVFTPRERRNGLGVIWVVSGGWYSAPEAINPMTMNWFASAMLDRGYTVFAVCHGSAPRFTIPEAISDLNRAVRFIRYNARKYKIDPDRIGIYGGSAGGHLSVIQGVFPAPPKEKSPDPVDRVSASVQAVGCFFPPTDFLNYGEPGKSAIDDKGVLAPFQASFDFKVFDDKIKKFVTVTDEQQVKAIATQISPIYHVDAKDPPTLIIHGDADVLVPYEQATRFIKKLEEAGVEAKLITKPGAGHGWMGIHNDTATITDWFDAKLAKKTLATQATTQAVGPR